MNYRYYYTIIVFLLFTVYRGSAQQLYLKPGVKFVLNGNIALVLNDAAINNNGTIDPGSSTVHFTGYSDTAISNITGASNTILTNLRVNKQAFGVAIKSPVAITNTLNMSAGNLYADSNLTLKSTASNTAMVTPVPPACQILGKAMVERYIPSNRAWRLLTAPLSQSNTIFDTWQNSGVYAAGTGTYVSGPGATGPTGNGLDISPQNNSSMYIHNPASQSFVPVTNTFVNLSQGAGVSNANTAYYMFIRGDRTTANFYLPNSNVTTLKSTGVLQTGTQTFTARPVAGAYSLIGNPYASPVNYNMVTRNNLMKRIYVWDPAINDLGAYVMLDDLDGDGMFTKSMAGSSITEHIQSGQAFFVQTQNTGAASITINEGNKCSCRNNIAFRPMANTMPSLEINLHLLNSDSTTTLADGALAQFDDMFSDSVTLDDALKFSNRTEEISLVRYGKSLTAERRPGISPNDTLYLKLGKTTVRKYQVELVANIFNNTGIIGILEDNFSGMSTPLNLTGVTKVDFDVTSDAASTGASRFRIVFKQVSVLPVTFTTVHAYAKNTGIAVEWKTEHETGIANYEVESSADDISFNSIGKLASTNPGPAAKYNWLDTDPYTGVNYYRIKCTAQNGTVSYSAVVKIITAKGTAVSIYPNPVKDNIIYLQLQGQPSGVYTISLINTMGQTAFAINKNISSGNTIQVLDIPQKLAKGIYQLEINGPLQTKHTEKIIIQ